MENKHVFDYEVMDIYHQEVVGLVNEQITVLGREQTEINRAKTQMNDEITDKGKEIERLSSENVSIQVHINAMAGTDNESSMQDLMAKVKSNNDKIGRCNERISTLKQNIEKMDKRLGDIKTLMGELKSDVKGLYNDMKNLQEAVYNADGSYAEYFKRVQEQVDGYSKRVVDIGNRVNSFTSKYKGSAGVNKTTSKSIFSSKIINEVDSMKDYTNKHIGAVNYYKGMLFFKDKIKLELGFKTDKEFYEYAKKELSKQLLENEYNHRISTEYKRYWRGKSKQEILDAQYINPRRHVESDKMFLSGIINLPGINIHTAKSLLEHLNNNGGGISLDEAERIIGREVNPAEIFNIETQYSLSAYDIDPGYFMAAYSQEKEELHGKGLFQAVTAVSASTSQFNPPEYLGNLDPNYRLDRTEINARNNMYYEHGYGGVAGEFGRQADIGENGKKLDYLFGKAIGNKHNIVRSIQMQEKLAKIGIQDTPLNRLLVESHLNDVLNNSNNIVLTETRTYIAKELLGQPTIEYTSTIKESLFMGPRGGIKFETVWEEDRLLTIIMKSGSR